MSYGGGKPNNKGTGNWWLVGLALLLGYFVGQGREPETRAPDVVAAPSEAMLAAEEPLADGYQRASDVVADASDTTLVTTPEAGNSDSEVEEVDAEQRNTNAYAAIPTSNDTSISREDEAAPVNSVQLASGGVAADPTPDAGNSRTYESTYPSAFPTVIADTSDKPRLNAYPAPSYSAPKCESLGCYGQISTTTGLPRTEYVSGYVRKDGTYVRPYYRSRRR